MEPAIAAELRAALDDLATWPPTKTGRPAFLTRQRRPRTDRPRIARRFVPRHSLAITLDWDLSPGARLCLGFLLACPREGRRISGVYAASIATQFGVSPRTASRWLCALEAEGYLARFPGRDRSTIVLLTQKATRWAKFSAADVRPKKTQSPRNPRLCERSRTISSATKAERIQGKKSDPTGARPDPADRPPKKISTSARIAVDVVRMRGHTITPRQGRCPADRGESPDD